MASSDRALRLRLELKEWEHAFAAAHDGRKPSRDEVKKDTRICAKYKEYNKLRSAPPPPPPLDPLPAPHSIPRKGSNPDDPFAPSNSSRPSSVSYSSKKYNRPTHSPFVTPTKNRQEPFSSGKKYEYESPSSTRSQRLFGNRFRDGVGPTPQKVGRVMGLFETFVDVESTPIRSVKKRSIFCESPANRQSEHQPSGRISASPAAKEGDKDRSGPFVTPRKRKAGESEGVEGSATRLRQKEEPGAFSTPSFLRRSHVRFSGTAMGSPPVPLPIAPPKRGLSSMLAELRKMEDEALDDDEEEAMREMENMENEEGMGGEMKEVVKKKPQPSMELVDGLPPLPEGAFVEEGLEIEEEEVKGDERPRWVKRGLKRQTKRVIMRPVKCKPSAPQQGPVEEEEPEIPPEIEEADASEDLADFSEYESEDSDGNPKAKRQKKSVPAVKADPKKKSAVAKGKEKEKVAPKKATRKINANAVSHANFRSLKLRNKNSKGRGGGRFSRGRRR